MTDFVSLFTGMSERDIGYLLKNMVQRSINEELTNSEISSIDNKTPVLLTNSKDIELMNDISIQSVINIETPTQYLMPEEPDGNNLKVWLKFQNAGELRDWSYQKNKSFAVGSNTMPGLFYRTEPNSMLKTELYSYFNGHDHFAYSTDAPPVQILPNITANKVTSFFIRLMPVSLSRLLASENNSLFTKVDDDQLRYGYSVIIDINGSIHFYIKNNYRQYHLFVRDAYNSLVTNPILSGTSPQSYRSENFNTTNFYTNYQTLCGIVALEPPFDDWFFKYNPTTHNMSVLKTVENNASILFVDTSTVTEKPYLSCPIQEGKYTHSGTVQTTIYDNSGNGNNGTLSGITSTPGGTWNDDNTLTSLGSLTDGSAGGLSIDFASIASLNTLTEFTVAFWINPLTEVINNKSYNTRIFSKGYAVADSIYIERVTGQNNIKFSFRKTDNVEQTVTFSNPFPDQNKWYFVVCKWKTGEKLKISVNNVEVQSSTNISGTLSTAANAIKLYNVTRAPIDTMALFKMWNIQISQTKQDELYYTGYHNPLFPKSENIQPVVSETPDPIFIPFSNAYTLDKMATPTSEDYISINSLSGANPFIPRYVVEEGVSTTDPELNPYTIADGATTASDPMVIIQGPGTAGTTLESSDSSNGILGNVSGGNRKIAMRIKVIGATIGTNIQGKKITRGVYDMRRIGTVTGTVYCKIWDAAGVEKGIIGSVPASSLVDGTYGAVTFENLTQSFTLPSGSALLNYRIGVEYTTGGSGDEVQVRRKSSNVDSSVNQDSVDWGNAENGWTSNGNDSFEVKCNLYTGTGTTSAEPNIIMKTGSYNRVAEAFGAADPLLTKVIGKVTLRLKKVGSPTGTATVVLQSSTNVVKATFSPTLNVSTGLTTSTADYTFTNYTHGQTVASTDRIAILWTPSASGEVHVMTNKGNTTGNLWNGTASSAFKYISSWAADSTIDLAGKIYTGGNDFAAYTIFRDGITRIATKVVNSSSSLHNRKISKLVSKIGKVGSISGIITATIRDANDVIRVQFSSVDASTIPADTAYHDIEFTNVTHNYLINSVLGSGDKISFEFPNGNTSNFLTIAANRDVIDGLNTITQYYDGVNYTDDAQRDLSGYYYEGGEPDLVSRTRVAQSIEHQDSRLKGKKITRVKAFLVRSTVGTSGTVYCNIRRGTDDSLVKTIGTVSASTLSTTFATPSQPVFEDTTNNYPMTVGDKVTIEYNGGDTTNRLGVLVRSVTPNYDLSNSYIRKYDEVDYDDELTAFDLCAVMDEGGFFFTPDPGSIPDPTPVNDKDLIICAGNNKLSGFFETFLMEFRIYSKDITTDNADNLYSNRYSISPIGNGQILMPFSLKTNTLDPI